MAYIGTEPKDVRSFGKAKFDFTATQGQTAFTGADDDGKTLGFTDGQINVYVNGILMDDSDYSTSGNNTVTLSSATNLNDIISVVALQTDIPNSDYVPATGGTFSNAVTIDADGATVLTVDRATSDGTVIDVQKGGTTVGSIGTAAAGSTNEFGIVSATGQLILGTTTNNNRLEYDSVALYPSPDNTVNLGYSTLRYKDLYLSGGVYLGGTGAANKLDGYEEGTWTPAITSGGLSVSTNHSSTYTKVGSLVHVRTYFVVSGTGTSAIFNIGGLPFTSIGNGYSPNIIDIGKGGKAGAYCRVGTNTTELEVLYSGDSPTAPRVNMAGNQIANDGPYIILQATYHTNA